MGKINCWEFNKCNKELDEKKSSDDFCSVPFDESVDGLFDGKNGGRVCWGLIGSCCDSKKQKSMIDKLELCSKCEFYKFLKVDESDFRKKKKEIMKKLMKRNQIYKVNNLEMREID